MEYYQVICPIAFLAIASVIWLFLHPLNRQKHKREGRKTIESEDPFHPDNQPRMRGGGWNPPPTHPRPDISPNNAKDQETQMEAKTEVTVDIQASCSVCGTDLTVDSPQTKLDSFEFTIEPCKHCLDQTKEESREDGYNNGYDDGFNNAKKPK